MTKFNFTDNKIRALKPEKKRYSVIDSKEDGLELFVHPKGTKTFCLYKRIDGIPQHKKLGKFGDITVAQAREIANRLKDAMYENVHLGKNDKLARITLNDVFENYMNSKISLGQRTVSEYQRLWEKQIKDTLGKMRVLNISIENLEAFRNRNADTPYQTNRCLSLIKAVYNYLINKKGYKITNPANGVETFAEKPCIRTLDCDEVSRIVDSINKKISVQVNISYCAILALMFISVRKSALLSMRWQDLHLFKRTWIVPVTKNKTNLSVSIPEVAVPIFELLKDNAKTNSINSEYVFYSKESKTGHLVDVKKAWQAIKKDANIEGRVRLHDFRHTFATIMAQLTGNAYQIKTALGHNSLQSSEVYVNLVKEQVQDVVNDTANKMLEKTIEQPLETGSAKTNLKERMILASKPNVKLEMPTQGGWDEITKLWNEQQHKR